ncbi:hypothetical protein FNV43_RR26485 [Rhamnella rubrinervis]|uniref:non-specific serine/threonine protein kinase n=1 Tax=Rhamnella rubrinervis TaxID=2594499 RepID=A0A8K0DPE0_9ROSA|nr:hypothetical protein FNV43_RR26485 [Rhamnella rubrinervis]
MDQNLFSYLIPWIYFLILSLFLFSDNFVGAVVHPYYQACSLPRSCCNNQTIKFPFYIKDLQEPYCGYPGFELSCNKNGQPILNLPSGVDYNYIIHQISYKNQSFIVSNSAFSNHSKTPFCIPPIQNLSIPSQFKLTSPQNQAFLLYDCRPPRVPKYDIGCSSENETNWVLGLSGNDINQVGNLSRKCGNGKVVAAPVKGYSHGSSVGVREVLSRGFELKWSIGNCSRCRSSGGLCGFNNSTYLLQCICPDRPHRVHCDHKGHASGNGTAIVKATIVQVRRYTYLDVKKMTSSFKEKLGQGGYGGVYKGNLHDGSAVAVKVLKKSKGNGEEFINEVATISRTSHVNVVALLGFCYEGRMRALLYEFMPNGSRESTCTAVATQGFFTLILSLTTFFLTKTSCRRSLILASQKNLGGVSHKSDVYSYGMMVLEMVGGRKNVNVEVDDTSDIYFPHWIYKRLELDHEELGLKRIMNEVEKIEVKKMIIVSLLCVQANPSNRPAMSKVIGMLEGSLDSLQMPPKPFSSS